MSDDQGGAGDDEARRRIGNRLKEARMYLGLSQEEVATYIKIHADRLAAIESGKEAAGPSELNRLARFYRQPVESLTGEHGANWNLPPEIAHLARQNAALTDSDRTELALFAQYLTARKEIEGENHGG